MKMKLLSGENFQKDKYSHKLDKINESFSTHKHKYTHISDIKCAIERVAI